MIDYTQKMTYTERLELCLKESRKAAEVEVGFLLISTRGLPTVSDNQLIQARYVAHRLDGMAHFLAEMLAFQAPPQSKTDREFLRGHCNGNQFEDTPWIGEAYKHLAQEAGVDPTGKVYLGQLARFPGDPEAWITGRGDVQRLCEERGWQCSGAVNVKASPLEASPEVPIAEDIVSDMVERRLEKMDQGDLQKVDLGELRHEVAEKHSPHWA